MSFIYSIYNKVTDRTYIGSTTNYNLRKRNHIDSLKKRNHHNYKLQKDYNKYGLSSFRFKVLQDLGKVDKMVLLQTEESYIKSYSKTYNIEKYPYSDPIIYKYKKGKRVRVRKKRKKVHYLPTPKPTVVKKDLSTKGRVVTDSEGHTLRYLG